MGIYFYRSNPYSEITISKFIFYNSAEIYV